MGRRANGEGSVYKDSQGRWTAALSLPPDPLTGRPRRRYVRARTRTEVVRRLRALQAEAARGTDLAAPTMLLGHWLDTWLRTDVTPRLKPATTADYESVVRTHLRPALGRRRLDRLTTDDVRALHDAVTARASAATAAKAHRVLSRALAVAVREGLLARNVASLVPAPRSRPARGRIPTADEARRVIRGCPDRERPRRMCSLLLGARQGEVLGMTLAGTHLDDDVPWVDLAWEVRRVTWAHGCGPRQGGTWPCGRRRGSDCPDRHAPVPAHLEGEAVHGGLWLLRPKTTASWRTPPLPGVLADALREHIAVYRPTRFVFEAAPGVPLDPRRDYEQWRRTLQELGIGHVRLHSARSTAATLLMEAGTPQRVVMEILGHTQAATTQRYERPTMGYQLAALEDLAALLADGA